MFLAIMNTICITMASDNSTIEVIQIDFEDFNSSSTLPDFTTERSKNGLNRPVRNEDRGTQSSTAANSAAQVVTSPPALLTCVTIGLIIHAAW